MELPDCMSNDRAESDIKHIRDQVGCGRSVSEELLVLSGHNPKLIVDCARASKNLNECKAHILNNRFLNMEAGRCAVSPTHDGFLPDSELQPNSPGASRILDQPQNERIGAERKAPRKLHQVISSIFSAPKTR